MFVSVKERFIRESTPDTLGHHVQLTDAIRQITDIFLDFTCWTDEHLLATMSDGKRRRRR